MSDPKRPVVLHLVVQTASSFEVVVSEDGTNFNIRQRDEPTASIAPAFFMQPGATWEVPTEQVNQLLLFSVKLQLQKYIELLDRDGGLPADVVATPDVKVLA